MSQTAPQTENTTEAAPALPAVHQQTATQVAARQQPAPTPIALGKSGVQLASLEDAFRFAKAVCLSGFAPKGMEKPESVVVAVQLGLELGMTPMAALQNIGVINGRPGIYGDAALALVRASGLCENYTQKVEGTGENMVAVVTSKRVGCEPIETRFSVADAKLADLWGKAGPWRQYPSRMLLFRARGFNLRDNFGDVLKGLRTSEELSDMPPEPKNVTPPRSMAEALGVAQGDGAPSEGREEGAAS